MRSDVQPLSIRKVTKGHQGKELVHFNNLQLLSKTTASNIERVSVIKKKTRIARGRLKNVWN